MSSRRARRLKRRLRNFFRVILLILAAFLLVFGGVSLLNRLPADVAAPVATAVPTPQPTIAPTATPTIVPTPGPTATPAPTARAAVFRVTGDVMASETMLKYALNAAGGDGYDYGPQFALIRQELANADYTMSNLETTIGMYKGQDYSGYPRFNTPEAMLDALRDCGIDLLTLANNHMLDRYFDGMKNTVAQVEAYGFDHCGAYVSREDRESANIVEINGIRFGFLSYTETTNGMEAFADTAAKEYGVPFLYYADYEGDVDRLRQAGAEVVIVFAHWGEEYLRQPNSIEKQYAKKIAEAGADIILGSHPHVLQKVDWIEADGRRVLVAYSLGNFISTQSHHGYTDTGMILEFRVEISAEGQVQIGGLGYVPTYCWKHDGTLQVVNAAKHYDSKPEGMSKSAYNRLRESYRQTRDLIDDSISVLTH